LTKKNNVDKFDKERLLCIDMKDINFKLLNGADTMAWYYMDGVLELTAVDSSENGAKSLDEIQNYLSKYVIELHVIH
jgi:hypothetical protein